MFYEVCDIDSLVLVAKHSKIGFYCWSHLHYNILFQKRISCEIYIYIVLQKVYKYSVSYLDILNRDEYLNNISLIIVWSLSHNKQKNKSATRGAQL